MKVTVDIDPEDVAAQLTRVSPDGLVFKHGASFEKADRTVAHVIDGARYVVVAGAPHGMLWTHADEVNAALVSFLD